MSYQTLEVDLENGRIRPRGSELLPTKARALLTIMEPEEVAEENSKDISLAERVRHLAGIGSGEYTDLSTNKVHLDDLGK